MVRWHYQLNGHEFEQTPGISEGQGSRACCSPMVTKSRTQLTNRKTTTTGVKKGGKKSRFIHTHLFFHQICVSCHVTVGPK